MLRNHTRHIFLVGMPSLAMLPGANLKIYIIDWVGTRTRRSRSLHSRDVHLRRTRTHAFHFPPDGAITVLRSSRVHSVAPKVSSGYSRSSTREFCGNQAGNCCLSPVLVYKFLGLTLSPGGSLKLVEWYAISTACNLSSRSTSPSSQALGTSKCLPEKLKPKA